MSISSRTDSPVCLWLSEKSARAFGVVKKTQSAANKIAIHTIEFILQSFEMPFMLASGVVLKLFV